MVLDFDHVALKETKGVTREWLVRSKFAPIFEDLRAVLGFVSPSGDGYKLFVEVSREMYALSCREAGELLETETARNEVAEAYKVIYKDRAQKALALGLELDESGSDITRACYVPADYYARMSCIYFPRVW